MKTYQYRVTMRVTEYWEVQANDQEDALDGLFVDGEPIECTREESVLEIEFIQESE